MADDIQDEASEEITGAPIEGGKVITETTGPGFDELQHHAQTASRITYVLLAVLVFTIALHYGGIMAAHFSGHPQIAVELSRLFEILLPVLSGLLGSALAFYFTQRRS